MARLASSGEPAIDRRAARSDAPRRRSAEQHRDRDRRSRACHRRSLGVARTPTGTRRASRRLRLPTRHNRLGRPRPAPPSIGVRLARIEVKPVAGSVADTVRISGGETVARISTALDRTDVEWTPRDARCSRELSTRSPFSLAQANERELRQRVAAARTIGVRLPLDTSHLRDIAIVEPRFEQRAEWLRRASTPTQPWMIDVISRLRADAALQQAAANARVAGRRQRTGRCGCARRRRPSGDRRRAGFGARPRSVAARPLGRRRQPRVGDADCLGSACDCRGPRRSPSSNRSTLPANTLASWQRAPATSAATRSTANANAGASDGRWLWIAVLVLLGVETWMRRTRRERRRGTASARTCSLTPPRFAPSSIAFAADSPGCRRPKARPSASRSRWRSRSCAVQRPNALRQTADRRHRARGARNRRANRWCSVARERVAELIERRAPQCRNLLVTANEMRPGVSVGEPIASLIYDRAARLARSLDPAALFPARNALVALGGERRAVDVRRHARRHRPRRASQARVVAECRDGRRRGRHESSRRRTPAAPSSRCATPRAVEALVGKPRAHDDPSARRPRRRRDAAFARHARRRRRRTRSRPTSSPTPTDTSPSSRRPRRAQAGVRRLIGLTVAPDEPPKVRITAPGKDVVFADGHHTIDLAIDASDDIGLASLKVRYTKVSGSGERFTFSEGDVPIQVARTNDRTWTARAQWRLDGLSLDAGRHGRLSRDRRRSSSGRDAVGIGFVHRRDSRAGRQRRAGLLARSRAGALRGQPADGHSQDRATRGAKSLDDPRRVQHRGAGPGRRAAKGARRVRVHDGRRARRCAGSVGRHQQSQRRSGSRGRGRSPRRTLGESGARGAGAGDSRDEPRVDGPDERRSRRRADARTSGAQAARAGVLAQPHSASRAHRARTTRPLASHERRAHRRGARHAADAGARSRHARRRAASRAVDDRRARGHAASRRRRASGRASTLAESVLRVDPSAKPLQDVASTLNAAAAAIGRSRSRRRARAARSRRDGDRRGAQGRRARRAGRTRRRSNRDA